MAKRRSSGRATPPRDKYASGYERDYAELLELRRRAGEIQDWTHEPEKLRLADRTYYTPDFRVVLPCGLIEFHEVKGFWRDDARVKIKVAAAQHPYTFVAASKSKGKWQYEHFNNTGDAA